MEAVIIKKKSHVYLALFFGFLLGIQNGFVALWEDGNPEPIRVFPYKASSLPAADQKRLEDGIHVASKSELVQMIEDYLS